MEKVIIYILGVISGVVIAVLVAPSISESPSKARADFTQKHIDNEQMRLSTTCLESPEIFRNYLNSLPPIIARIKNGERIKKTDPVLSEGEKVNDVLVTCSSLNRYAAAEGLALPTPQEFTGDQFVGAMSVIALGLAKTTAQNCEQICIDNAIEKLTESMTIANQILATPHVPTTK